MENQYIVYSAQELLAMTQGPALLHIMENPDDLRVAIDCLERATTLLASIEQCRYPEQVRTHSKAKRLSSATTVTPSAPVPVLDPTERLRARILSLVGRHWEKEGRGATMREIRNPNRTVSPDDITEMISILVHEGALQAVPARRTIQYVPYGVVAVQTKTFPPVAHLSLDGSKVGIYVVVLQDTEDGRHAYVVNRSKTLVEWYTSFDFIPVEDQDLVFVEGSKGHKVVLDWLRSVEFNNSYYILCDALIIREGNRWVP